MWLVYVHFPFRWLYIFFWISKDIYWDIISERSSGQQTQGKREQVGLEPEDWEPPRSATYHPIPENRKQRFSPLCCVCNLLGRFCLCETIDMHILSTSCQSCFVFHLTKCIAWNSTAQDMSFPSNHVLRYIVTKGLFLLVVNKGW